MSACALLRWSRWFACVAALAPVLAAADEPARAIVQQRLPDGSILFTDRPQADARTERRWSLPASTPDDEAAAARRAKTEAETAAINERFARQLEQQRDRDAALEIERQRSAAAYAEREAAQARLRETYEPDYAVGWPFWSAWPPRVVRPPHPPKPFPVPPGFKPYEPPPPALPVIKPRPRSDLRSQRPQPEPRP